MRTAKWFNSDKGHLFSLVVLAAAFRLYFLFRYDNMPGEAAGYVVRALQLMENPDFVRNFDASSMLYKMAIALVMFFWRDPVFAPRFFTLIFGVLLILPYYGTIRTLFDKRIAFFSGLALALYPLHVVQSSIPASDAVYYFFLFSSFYYFFMFRERPGRVSLLLIAAGLFNVAALLRFECWLFIPVMSLLLWKKGIRFVLLFFACAVILPLASLAVNQMIRHDFLYSLNTASQSIRTSILALKVPYDPRLWSWFFLLLKSSGPSLAIGGVLGIALAVFQRQKHWLAIFFLVLFSVFTVNAYLLRMWHNERYSIPLALLLIPYAWFLVDRFLALCGARKKIFFPLFLIVLIADFGCIAHRPALTMGHMLNVTPPQVRHLAGWLEKNVRPGEGAIIDDDPYSVYTNNIVIHSKIPLKQYLILMEPTIEKGYFEHKEDFETFLAVHRTKYLLLNSKSYLQRILRFDLSKKKFDLDGASFEVAFEQDMGPFGSYFIYTVFYGKQGVH